MSLLEISELVANVDDTEILKGVSLSINAGEVHAIMGPNGSGKSTLAYALAGRDGYQLASGEVRLNGADISAWSPEERSLNGLFLGFQHPIEIDGVTNLEFLKVAVDSHRFHNSQEELSAVDFMKEVRARAQELGLQQEFLKRYVNVGFSGGEKKRNDILQLLMLQPKVAVLDETDSGLDVDALQVVAKGINSYRNSENGILLITHYQRLLDYIEPNFVHVLVDGQIVRSGDAELAKEVEKNGYVDLERP